MPDIAVQLIEEISSSKERIRLFLHNSITSDRACSLLMALRDLIDNAHCGTKVLVVTPSASTLDWRSLIREFGFKKDVRIVTGLGHRQAKKRIRLDKSIWAGNGFKIVSMDLIKNLDRLKESLAESWDVVVLDEAHQFSTAQRSEMANAIWASDNVRTCIGMVPDYGQKGLRYSTINANPPFGSGLRQMLRSGSTIDRFDISDPATNGSILSSVYNESESVPRYMEANDKSMIAWKPLLSENFGKGKQKRGAVPKYSRLGNLLLSAGKTFLETGAGNLDGVTHKGLRLPSEIDLTEMFSGISRTTARKAIQSLQTRGLVYRDNSGSYLSIKGLSHESKYILSSPKSLKSFMEESSNASNGESEETATTRFMSEVKDPVCAALADGSTECDSLFGVYGQYGAGKTHSMRLLRDTLVSDALKSLPSANPTLVTPPHIRFAVLRQGRDASFDRNDWPASDHSYTLWGDLAYQLAGDLGYQLFSREQGITKPPTSDAISILLKGGPTLILIDDLDEQLERFNDSSARNYSREFASDELAGELEDTVSCARNYLEEFLLALFDAVVETPRVALVFSVSSDANIQQSFVLDHKKMVKFQLDPLTFVPNETKRRAIYQIASDRNFQSPREAIEWIFDQGLNNIQKGDGKSGYRVTQQRSDNRMKRLHEKVILELTRQIKAGRPDAHIQPNSKFRKQHHRVPDMSVDYYPDVIDFTNKVAYEVHLYGNGKVASEERWDKMPDGWKGVNVFTGDICQKDEVFVWSPDGEYVHINKDDWNQSP